MLMAIIMPAHEAIIDWNKQRIPIGLGFAGLILVALNNLIYGFVMIVIALLFGAYNSDSTMELKDTW